MKLYNNLKQTTLSMPQLLLLSAEELHAVADGVTTQLVRQGELQNLYKLTDREKNVLTKAGPASLHDLKECIKRLISEKSKQSNIEYVFNSDSSPDSLISHAARLGRFALRDEKLMLELWDRFKCQSKIAALLSVNRSSVHNRLKQYRKTT